MTEVLVVSDTHLSPRTPPAAANWEAVVDHVGATRPDLVLHLGDLTLDGSNAPAELRMAREELDRLAVPWVAVPGNHDIGDNPSAGIPVEWEVSEARLEAWLDVIGPDRIHVEVGGAHLIGINAMLAGSDLDAEEDQWSWLAGRLAGIPAGAPVVLASHKPVDGPDGELADASPARFVPLPGRERLAGLLAGHCVVLVLSGHVHQHRMLDLAGRTHHWAPTTWAALPDEWQPPVGDKCCGALVVGIDGGAVTSALVRPDGLADHTIGVDIANPYRPAR